MNNIFTKYADKAAAVREVYDGKAHRIVNNTQWHDQAKAEAMNELKEKTNAELQSLRDQLNADQESRVKELEPKLFAVEDHPSVISLYRDAIQRSKAVAKDQEQLSDLMDQALDTGDKTLAKGAAFVAFKHGYFDLARRAYDGVYQKHFDQYLELQSSLSDPISKEAIEVSFMFAAV